MTEPLDSTADESAAPQSVDGPADVVDAPASDTADAAPADDTAAVPDGTHEVEAGVVGIEAKFLKTEFDGAVAYQPLINPADNPEGSYDPTGDDVNPRLDNRKGKDRPKDEAFAPVPQNVDGPEIGGKATDSNA